ncbi:copper resistance protein CopC [Microbacterium sp. Sa4CUA7]|uniref:Copper resistance protein CopC n=1 Tax=Microbacterium pullorum TaxID=2762236 RepID=A0ABR8S3M4_9MICO|nr:copper resistance protein CopC [Microbacterium pullorum]
MSQGIHLSLTRRLAAVAAAIGLGLAAVLVTAVPASAHDELLVSDPADGASVEALPEEITLTFSAFPLDEPGATIVEVTDATGTDLTSGDPIVDGTQVTQALEGAATGVVSVLWKVVSSDGHPIDGEFTFTVAGGDPTPSATAPAEPSDTAEPTADDSTAPTDEVTATPAPAADGDESSPALVWTIAVVVLAALVAAVTYLIVSRSRRDRRERDLAQGRANAATGGDQRPDQD